MDTLREVVSTPSFIQAALLVALTGALSGFLIPWIKGSTDDKQARQQKIVDVDGNEFCVVKPNRADATRSLSCTLKASSCDRSCAVGDSACER